MYRDTPRGVAHVVLIFVSLGFIANGSLFAAKFPASVGFLAVILPPLEFGIAIAAALVGWLAYQLRRRLDRGGSDGSSHRRSAIALALLTGLLWFGIDWCGSEDFKSKSHRSRRGLLLCKRLRCPCAAMGSAIRASGGLVRHGAAAPSAGTIRADGVRARSEDPTRHSPQRANARSSAIGSEC